MKSALILCGGKATRLRPYSHILPKACIPFLNLPLLSLNWFYLEYLNVSRFLLNSHLFPEKLKNCVSFLSQPEQERHIFFEAEPLGSAGTLHRLKKELQKTKQFFYINGDSLFFPKKMSSLLSFEKHFSQVRADGLLFSAPVQKINPLGKFLWSDKDLNLKFVGSQKNLPKGQAHKLLPFYFSGLALFNSTLLDHISPKAFDLFLDFIMPLLPQKSFKIFADKGAFILEAGDKLSYIESSRFCMNILFDNEKTQNNNTGKNQKQAQSREFKKILEMLFSRFDPKDQLVGLKAGKQGRQKSAHPLLAPNSVRHLKNLELKGFAILGPGTHLFGKSPIKDSILGPKTPWIGELTEDIIILHEACFFV